MVLGSRSGTFLGSRTLQCLHLGASEWGVSRRCALGSSVCVTAPGVEVARGPVSSWKGCLGVIMSASQRATFQVISLSRELFVNLVRPCFSCSPRSWTPLLCSLWTVFLLLSSLTPTGVATCIGETWRGSCSPLGCGSVQSRCRPPGVRARTGPPWVARDTP